MYKSLIRRTRLPNLYLICPKPQGSVKSYIDKFTLYLNSGVRLFQLRFGDLYYPKYTLLIKSLLQLSRTNNAKILINSTPEYAVEIGAHGVHLNNFRLLHCDNIPAYKNLIVCASCHNTTDLQHAHKMQVDCTVLSPVKKTKSHPISKKNLGWDTFRNIVKPLTIPVYALGGMQAEDLPKSRLAGAHGIAVLSAAWNNRETSTPAFLKKYLQNR